MRPASLDVRNEVVALWGQLGFRRVERSLPLRSCEQELVESDCGVRQHGQSKKTAFWSVDSYVARSVIPIRQEESNNRSSGDRAIDSEIVANAIVWVGCIGVRPPLEPDSLTDKLMLHN